MADPPKKLHTLLLGLFHVLGLMYQGSAISPGGSERCLGGIRSDLGLNDCSAITAWLCDLRQVASSLGGCLAA